MKSSRQILAAAVMVVAAAAAPAADHLESLQVVASTGGDIADVYAFLDPNDNSYAVLAMDVRGFIVPGENSNISAFDSDILFRLDIENTGDFKPDAAVSVRFDRQTSRTRPQTAHITLSPARGKSVSFDAPTTVSSATAAIAPGAEVTTDPASGIAFFAGLREDPFFFDIPGFNRFVASAQAGAPDPSALSRGRDTFAGYNVQMITLRIPVALLQGAGNVIGVSATTQRSRSASSHAAELSDARGRSNALEQIDRMGLPVINTVVIPFARKDEYNGASVRDDARGVFADDIVATLRSLGTNEANIGLLASLAVTRGDQLRLNLAVANIGAQGGLNEGAGFPNGRRPADDVIDTVLGVVTNGAISADNVNGNDAEYLSVFPFFAPPNQPRARATVDDNTRN